MRKIVCSQLFTRYVSVLDLLKEAELLFDIIRKNRCEAILSECNITRNSEKCLLSEEVLFIEVLRDLNQRAGKYHEEEQLPTDTTTANETPSSTLVTLGALLFDRTESPPTSSFSTPAPPAAPQPKLPVQLEWIQSVNKNTSAAHLKRKSVVLME